MRRLTDSARRARDVLERENSVLSAECEKIAVRDVQRTLSEFFKLSGDISFKVERKGKIVITISAEAVEAKPFGVL